jgi:serine/threonine protein kinase, bacterial
VKTKEIRVVKQLRPSKQRNKKEVSLFQNEIYVMRRLSHNNLPELFEAFSYHGDFFYVMSYIKGDNLEDQIFINNKTFTEEESLLFLAHLLELVDYLHSKEIYHQDLRIPNVILKNREPYLIDFGLSKQGNSLDSVNSPSNIDSLELKRQDYYDLGEVLLYLLYTTYCSKKKKALPWTEELSLKKETTHLLKRLLRMQDPYSGISGISADLRAALCALEKEK